MKQLLLLLLPSLVFAKSSMTSGQTVLAVNAQSTAFYCGEYADAG